MVSRWKIAEVAMPVRRTDRDIDACNATYQLHRLESPGCEEAGIINGECFNCGWRSTQDREGEL